MLVISRKKGESFIIQDNIEVTILGVDAETIKIGITAPKEVEIFRKEIYMSIKASNIESADNPVNFIDELKKLNLNIEK